MPKLTPAILSNRRRAPQSVARLVKWRSGRGGVAGRVLGLGLGLLGIDVPLGVRIGADLRVAHRAHGLVINPNTVIGERVTIYQRVTIGRRDSWVDRDTSRDAPVVIGDDVVLCAGSVVLGGTQGLVVGRGTVLGANAVLTESTGEWEIWTGAPARRVGDRRA